MEKGFLFRQECKPCDYRFLSINLKSLGIFSGNKSVVMNIEKVLMKSIMIQPVNEQRIPLNEVLLYEGRHSQMVRFLSLSLTREKHPVSSRLIKLCRIKNN